MIRVWPQFKMFFLTALLSLSVIAGHNLWASGESTEENRYQGPDYCLDCHAKAFDEWVGSPHDQAYRNGEFQSEWQSLGEPDSCLSCHTTGFEEGSATYASEGVTCEACHGPGDTMSRDVTPELCGECHSGPFPTYEEWRNSGPSHGNATCVLCHDEHTAGLTARTSTGTCAICHESHLEAFEATAHGLNGVECSDCHMYRRPADFETGAPAITGHDFVMTSDQLDCATCHDRPLSKHDILGEKAFACLSCHGDIHGLDLELVNGTKTPLDDPVGLCAQCHNERYTAWRQGIHGKPLEPDAKCTDCHDPHDPVIAGFSTIPAVPPRVAASGPSIPATTVFVIVLELLGFAVLTQRWKANE